MTLGKTHNPTGYCLVIRMNDKGDWEGRLWADGQTIGYFSPKATIEELEQTAKSYGVAPPYVEKIILNDPR